MSTGIGYVLLATIGWSLSGLFVRLMPNLDGWQINCWRGLWMSLSLAIYLIIVHGRNIANIVAEVPLPAVIWSALFFSLGTTAYVTSLTLVSTATVSVIGATSPLITGLLSPWLTREKPGVLALIAALIALAGMSIIAYHGFGQGTIIGIMFSIAVPLTFAGQTLMLRRYRQFDLMPAIGLGGFLAFLVAAAASIFVTQDHSAFNISVHDFGLLMLMGPIQLALPLVFYGMGAKLVPAFTLSLIAMLDAVTNPFWPWLFLNEVPGKTDIIGGGIILMAVAIYIVGSRIWKPRQV